MGLGSTFYSKLCAVRVKVDLLVSDILQKFVLKTLNIDCKKMFYIFSEGRTVIYFQYILH